MKEINIAEILKNKPRGTKLYSLTYGDCFYQEYTGDFGIECQSQNGVQFNLDEYDKYCIDGECIIFPSKEMRDWEKFAWKRGDILVSNDGGTEVIFDKWYDETYTSFYCKHYLNSEDENKIVYHEAFLCTTERYSLEDKDSVQTYINTIEERLGGKLNRETLEVEKAQPEFNDGDIVALVVRKCTHIAIFQSRQEAYIGFHAVLCQNDELLLEKPFREDVGDIELRLATDSEKQQLFDALAKEGKAWDSEKKIIVELKPKVELKPFDNVLVRDSASDNWRANLFGYIGKDGYYHCVYANWAYCIPYIGNESLLGTTKDVEG